MEWQRLDSYQERQYRPEGNSYGNAGEKSCGTIKARHMPKPDEVAQSRHVVGREAVHISPRWIPARIVSWRIEHQVNEIDP